MPEAAPGEGLTAEAAASIASLRLVLMGTGPFAVPAFEALAAAGATVQRVVTRPQRAGPGGRSAPPSPVREWAAQRGLPLAAPESINDPAAIDDLARWEPDLLVVCDYGQILRPEALGAAARGGINLHGSLLPAYRGAAPVQWAILRGETTTGVSVIHMTPRLDAGPILARRETPIDPRETAGDLEARLAQLGVPTTLEAAAMLARWDGHTPIGTPQDPSQVSKAPRLRKSDGRIDWTRSAAELDCHVRGMQPWPGAFTERPAEPGRPALRLAVKEISPTDKGVPGCALAGAVHLAGGDLEVAAGDLWVRIERLQPAGRREMTAAEWLRGRPLVEGELLR